MDYKEPTEWCDLRIGEARGTTLPRTLIIGDSIANSYYSVVNSKLIGKFAGAKMATSSSVCHPYFARQLKLLLDEFNFDVIHFNNGLHGWDYSEAAYRTGMAMMIDRLTAHYAGCKIILASSTPVWNKGVKKVLAEKNQRVIERNQIVATLANERGLVFNDLYREVIDCGEYVSDDGIHFKTAGENVLANKVTKAIIATLI